MGTLAGIEALVLALYAGPLVVAALWDVATFRIPNTLNLAFLSLFPLAGLLAPQPPDWLWHLAAFGVVLAVGFPLFLLRLLGGGDVKLLVAAALWLGWDRLLEFSILVALAGGALSLALVVLRLPLMQMAWAHLGRTPRVLQKQAPVPYGVAIAVGGLLLAAELPLIGP